MEVAIQKSLNKSAETMPRIPGICDFAVSDFLHGGEKKRTTLLFLIFWTAILTLVETGENGFICLARSA